jgi:hypothetical protein
MRILQRFLTEHVVETKRAYITSMLRSAAQRLPATMLPEPPRELSRRQLAVEYVWVGWADRNEGNPPEVIIRIKQENIPKTNFESALYATLPGAEVMSVIGDLANNQAGIVPVDAEIRAGTPVYVRRQWAQDERHAFLPSTQIRFFGVEGLIIHFDATRPGTFDSAPLVSPATHNFGQRNIFRLKLSNIPGHPGEALFPTLEIAPANVQTQAFLAHSSVPVEFTDADFEQVFSGDFVVKVIYLPNSESSEITMSKAETLISTQLLPEADAIAEAKKRGSILAIIRMGNKDWD